ncbi:MAG: hypothetical protein ABL929_05700 [Ferruginibacter sp.]|nr:hypothetical protein [Ferruginibacter sp.]
MIYIGKNIAGKDRFMITITGSIIILLIAWLVGKKFMPKTFANKKHKLEGIWFSKSDTGFVRMDIRSSGYFYFDIVANKEKTHTYKGVLNKQKSDTLEAISFSNDTLLYHKIIEQNNNNLKLKSLQDSSIISFTK